MDKEMLKELEEALGGPITVIEVDPGYNKRQEQMMQLVMDTPEIQELIRISLVNLIAIAGLDPLPEDDENRKSYLREDLQPMAKDIGTTLNESGGIELMRIVHGMVTPILPIGDPRVLEFAWDGIGEWRC